MVYSFVCLLSVSLSFQRVDTCTCTCIYMYMYTSMHCMASVYVQCMSVSTANMSTIVVILYSMSYCTLQNVSLMKHNNITLLNCVNVHVLYYECTVNDYIQSCMYVQ